ncbi:transcription factor-like 5 protein, partial [Xenopus laevis]|uniref:Transcription factor-like 5 protein n=1 Tax=Xenopus laevis TaxID=8355 RepID=A0A8J1M005_XENLA
IRPLPSFIKKLTNETGDGNITVKVNNLFNIMAMSDSDYRQLQQISCSHMEGPGIQGPLEVKLNPAFFPQYQSENLTNQYRYKDGSQCGHHETCQELSVAQSDSQEPEMMVLTNCNNGNSAEKTPCNTNRSSSRAKAIAGPRAANKENEILMPMSAGRSKSAVCVRLEERFSSLTNEMPWGQGPHKPDSPMRNLVTLIRHVQQPPGAQEQVLKPTATSGCHPEFPASVCLSVGGICTLEQAKTSGNSCPLLEAARHQEISLPRAFSFCYQQEAESAEQTQGGGSRNFPEQDCPKLGDASCRRRTGKRSHAHQWEHKAERKALRELQNAQDPCDPEETETTSWSATQARASEQELGYQQGGLSQRREKHNRMERDRRRRIRVCCDELNLLVPFCNGDTDKATTLQWTTAFLRYLQEKHGDALKAEFESEFSSRTGGRVAVPDTLQKNIRHSSLLAIK